MFRHMTDRQIREAIAQSEHQLQYTSWYCKAERREIEEDIRLLNSALGLREARRWARTTGRNAMQVR